MAREMQTRYSAAEEGDFKQIEEDERDIDLDTQLDASAEELAHFDEANATRHLDASQHHDDYDAFMQQHLGDTD